MTEVDLFISTQRIKVLSADTQVCQANLSEDLFVPLFCLLFDQASKEGTYSLGQEMNAKCRLLVLI